MPKMKTKKSLAKRVKVTGTGKWKIAHAYTSHLAQNKKTKQKRHLRKAGLMDQTDQSRLKQLLQG
ncbi:50S ribosomal protein L35 [Spiroplasma citri]|uniref:Large ribosomal subunit protein bL35 n=1 Tax=Spiroplasma citri TaxID=2133 RepID=Q14NX5_SPICI|nr:50S ribosomal protein L35 [Spiroplasma citri]APE75220.1 50S ribosomal protein L35 [Spiroplasma citri]QED25127.1 50S ribosomal protein L35 [Spiroplasma citri]QIA67463.1 50S ribosomal protein L35 [Spiroplasma citri]QIA69319.1 50S ribosomal protein L35 [Spiroplasma citri]QIA71186.1 50S ribosomal protein L35 [Spiroplasma citri]